MSKLLRNIQIMVAALGGALSLPAQAETWLDAEVGVFTPAHNRVQIPNDNRGDRFELTELGDNAFALGRLTLGWQPSEKHELQFVYAPFVYKEDGAFDQDVRFDGATFAAGDEVEARYQFSNYRLRYLYHWKESARWQLDVGATLFVRDASIQLRSSTTTSKDANVGVVPLFAVRNTYRFNDIWSVMADSDVAIAPQGRAIDLALLGQYRVSDTLSLSAGYRTVEGGADNDEVYNFAWFNGAVLKATYHF